jgi:hypothetical protein
MKSIMLTYPGFQTLPRGVKQMLVASENDFFSDARPAAAKAGANKLPQRQAPRVSVALGQSAGASEFHDLWRN